MERIVLGLSFSLTASSIDALLLGSQTVHENAPLALLL